jgi:prolyl oligopeptidase
LSGADDMARAVEDQPFLRYPRPMLLTALLLAAAPALPATPKKPVVDDYFGTKITDEYRWLEAGADPEVQKWSDAQNVRTRAVLDKLPGRDALTKRLTELLSYEAPVWFGLTERKGTVFAFKRQPPKAQPLIVALKALDSVEGERVLLDPSVVDPSGDTSIDFFEPSLDGKYFAVSLSKKGTERGDVHVYETATGKELTADVVPAVNTGTAGGTLAWTDSGFFYTRHPLEGERPAEDLGFFQQVYFHKLGTPTRSDTYALGKDFLRIAENFLSTTRDGKWAADLVQKGDGGEYELFLKSPDNKWTKISTYEDKIVHVAFGRDNALYLLSRKGAPKGQVLKLPLVPGKLALASATVLVPAGDAAIQAVTPTKARLYVTEQLGVASRVRILGLDGKAVGEVPAPPATALSGAESLGEEDDIAVAVTGYLNPLTISKFTAKDSKLTATALVQKTPADLSGFEVQSGECVSKDGTKVPITVVSKKGLKLDGNNPTLLTGYGGFGISQIPSFGRERPAWLEQGAVYAVAAIRGGGEFGEDWHQNGMLSKKQNVFDDFLACAKWLTEKKYTSAKKLAIEGGSNGGLLMGAALTQAPTAFKAVVSHVGYYDMLRYEQAANGVFNTTEYGSVKDEAAFKALAAYSPYQAVKEKTQYPSILMLTGKNDPRVEPFHSRKMIARLQASGTRQPVLLRTSDTGHGGGTPLQERIAQAIDVYAFLFSELGVKVK